MNAATPTVPDLLRRFVPTPYVALVEIGDLAVRVETNDLAIIAEMQGVGVQSNAPDSVEPLFLKVIRDQDVPGNGRDITLLSAYPLAAFLMGTGTVFALDCERREALGFIAQEVTAAEFADTLFPIIRDLLMGAASITT
jgi:uncharacterized protein YebE (UPF0316 family)